MRTPIGRISRVSLFLVFVVVATIVTGMIWPGHTGVVIESVGWAVLALGIIFEVGFRTTPMANLRGEDRANRQI